MLVLVALVQRPVSPVTPGPPYLNTMIAMICSNQSYAAYLPDRLQHSHNQLDCLAWTTGQGSNFSRQ
jgi:hypothetical protein